jgi:hypothetical protein
VLVAVGLELLAGEELEVTPEFGEGAQFVRTTNSVLATTRARKRKIDFIVGSQICNLT